MFIGIIYIFQNFRWDSFPLFLILNDYLRTDDNLKNGKFHEHLRQTFAPQVIRYVDLMESSIAQSIHKGFEKERWEIKGNGCATSEDLFWKLDALQSFIRDLHWPDMEFAEHLNQRLKMMACDMIDSCIKRTDASFQNHLNRIKINLNPTDYIVPTEICAMINVVIDAKNQSFKLCAVDGIDVVNGKPKEDAKPKHKYHTKIDELIERTLVNMKSGLVAKLTSVLKSVLDKLSRYDEGTVFGGILSSLNKNNLTGSGTDVGKSYIAFVQGNMTQIEKKIKDDLWVLSTMERWYADQVQMLCTWLTDRLDRSLHHYQCTCLVFIVKKLKGDFELCGVEENKLNSQHWQNVEQRMQTEEAAFALAGGEVAENGDSDEEVRKKPPPKRTQSKAKKPAPKRKDSNYSSDSEGGDCPPPNAGDFDEEDEEEQPNPAKAAKEMKEALTSGGVNAMADLGANAASKLGGGLMKGMGGFMGGGKSSFGGFF